jgi:thioredoxin-related protein
MKNLLKVISLLLIFTTGQTIFAQQTIHLTESGLNAALEKSKIEHKPVFFMCYASWCPHCNAMRKNIFTDPSVADYFNQHFICVAQDMEKGEGVELHERLKIESYPTFIFFDSDGTTLYRITGEFKAPEFIKEGMNAVQPEKQIPYLKQQFEKDISNPDNCLTYLRALKKGGLDFSSVVKTYFATQSEQQLLTEMNWMIISNGITDINSREFQFVLSHQKEFASITSPERVERKIIYLVKQLLNPMVMTKDTTGYYIKREPAAAVHLYKVDSLIFTFDNLLYETTGNWTAYKKSTLTSTEKYAWNNYSQLNEIANIYLKNISDTLAITRAVKWVQRSLALHEEYGTCILGAKLDLKINHKQEAIQLLQKGKSIAVKYGWDYSEGDKLLENLR